MVELREGQPGAAAKLTELLYPELRRTAAIRMKRENPCHSWQPTVLVNELYLELVRIGKLPNASAGDQHEKDSFLNFAAHLMRRLLIHHARPLARRVKKVPLEDSDRHAAGIGDALLEKEDVLSRLARINPNPRALVEMKVFEGLSREEIAERLGCTTRTVTRHWDFAKTWLQHELAGGSL